MKPNIEAFFDDATWTVSYVVSDEPNGHCAIIEADRLIEEKNLTTEWILETHAHADHLTAAHYLKGRLGGKTAIGKEIPIVQETFRKIFNLETDLTPDGKQFDHLFADNEVFSVGKLSVKALSTPGHTPADLSYQVEEAIFVGDTLFMPDVGAARADFPGGNARTLFRSIRKILDYPVDTRLFMCHDYPPQGWGRLPRWETSVGEQRANNIHVRAGIMPPPENNGISYLKIPLNVI